MIKLIIFIKKLAKKITDDNLAGYAAQSTFYLVLSFFPFLLVLVSLIKYLPISSQTAISYFSDFLPDPAMDLVQPIIEDIYSNSNFTIISFSAIGTIWAAGTGFMAIIKELNLIYDTSANHAWIVQRIMSMVYTFLFMITMLATLILMVFGNKISKLLTNYFPTGLVVFTTILSKKLIIIPAILIIILALMYAYIPARKSNIFLELPGAILATIAMVAFTYLYSFFFEKIADYSYTYGSMATQIFAMLWILFSTDIVFLGAELNSVLIKREIKPFLDFHEKRKLKKQK